LQTHIGKKLNHARSQARSYIVEVSDANDHTPHRLSLGIEHIAHLGQKPKKWYHFCTVWKSSSAEEFYTMAPSLESLGIDRMSIEDRIALVAAIWDGIAAEPHEPSLTEAQRQELERRLADDEANPDDVVPWEQVKALGVLGTFRPG
jgi:putative addiction module component (TIGR02574 family)